MMAAIGVICTTWILSFVITLSTVFQLCNTGWIPEDSDSLEDFGFETLSTHDKSEQKSFPRILHDNGMLHLVLHDLARELLLELDKHEHELDTKLSPRQRDVVFDKVKNFYDRIMKHPALSNDRIAFAQTKPDFNQYVPSTSLESRNHKMSKRSGLMDEVCRSQAQWTTMATGETRDRRIVPLYEDQYFYVTTCENEHEPCDHISSRYVSQCRERSSWTIAFIYEEDQDDYAWDWISVNTCCSCATALI